MRNFYCYIHRLGAFEPELQILESATIRSLPDDLVDKMRDWLPFDMIDVYDDGDQKVFCVAADDRAFRN